MIYLERRLNPKQIIDENFEEIIEAFTKYYGEENRQNIEEKFKNMYLVCSQTPKSIKRTLNEIKINYSKNVILDFFKTFDLKYNEENINALFGISKIPFEHPEKLPIMKYIKNEKKLPNNLSEINNKEKLNEISLYLKNIILKYQNIKNKYKQNSDYIQKCNEFKKLLNKKYMDELINRFITYFPSKEIEEYQNKGIITGKMYAYLGNNIETVPLINAFSNESDSILNSPSSKSWEKEFIKKDRINYFKKLNLDLGEDYNKYLNNPKCKSLIPNTDLIDEIIYTKEYLEQQMYLEYYENLPEYKFNRQNIDKINLKNKDDGYNLSVFFYNQTYMTPNIKIENENIIVFPIVNINFEYINEYIDKYIIHELNHVYELTYDISQNKYICGWEIKSDTKKLSNKYSALNEIINDIIASEITDIMHKKGIYLFYNEESAKTKGGTTYENYKFLVQDFFDVFKPEIIASRKGDIQYLIDVCGQENFEQLNDLINEFNTKDFTILPSNPSAIIEKFNNSNLNEYYNFIKRKEEIISKMLKHKNKNLTLHI